MQVLLYLFSFNDCDDINYTVLVILIEFRINEMYMDVPMHACMMHSTACHNQNYYTNPLHCPFKQSISQYSMHNNYGTGLMFRRTRALIVCCIQLLIYYTIIIIL